MDAMLGLTHEHGLYPLSLGLSPLKCCYNISDFQQTPYCTFYIPE